MKKVIQILPFILVLPYCILINILLRSNFQPSESYLFSFLFYWIYICISILFFVKFNKQLVIDGLRKIKRPKSILIGLIAFVPVVIVFFVAFFPIIGNLKIKIIVSVIAISLFNGFIEEFFWRGIGLSIDNKSWVIPIVITLFFGAFHFSFSFLNISYQGGLANLVGGSLFMGLIWVIIAKKTDSIFFGIIAHQLVNFFAFTSLYVHNIF